MPASSVALKSFSDLLHKYDMCTAQGKAHERQKVTEAESAQLRQALTSQAAEGSPTEAERCRQAEQLLAQQVRLSLTVHCSHLGIWWPLPVLSLC